MRSRRWGVFSFRMLMALVCVLAGQGAAKDKYSGGQGTVATPWIISTPNDLSVLAATSKHWNNHFVQDASIDMSNQNPISSIGTFDVPFTGTYDGGGFSIRDVMILAAPQSQPGGDGLFGVVQGNGADVTIQKLVLENPTVLGASTDSGGLVGRMEIGTIQQCGVKGGYISGTENTGGLAGQVRAQAAVRECYSTACVLGAGAIGGLIGLSAGVVEDCYCKSNILAQWGDWPQAPDSVDIGGLVGRNDAGWVATSYANCDRLLLRVGISLVSVNTGGLVGTWLPAGSTEYLFIPNNYSSKETLGLAAAANNAIGWPTSADLTRWNNLVVASVSVSALRQRSTFKHWDFDYIWTIDAGDMPRLQWE
jgi:hypothetical protein